jgi:hypothetical protein
MAIDGIARVCGVATKSIDPAVRATVRALVQDIVKREFGNNKSAAARGLKISQSFVSEIMGDGRGAGLALLLALRTYVGRSIDDLCGLPPLPPNGGAIHVDYDPRYPNVTRATTRHHATTPVDNLTHPGCAGDFAGRSRPGDGRACAAPDALSVDGRIRNRIGRDRDVPPRGF